MPAFGGKQAPPFTKKKGSKKAMRKDKSAPVQKALRAGRSMGGGGRY